MHTFVAVGHTEKKERSKKAVAKKNKVRKITEAEYAKYLADLQGEKSGKNSSK